MRWLVRSVLALLGAAFLALVALFGGLGPIAVHRGAAQCLEELRFADGPRR